VLFNVKEALVPGSTDFYVSDAERAVYYAPSAEELVAGPAALQAHMPALDRSVNDAPHLAALLICSLRLSSKCEM